MKAKNPVVALLAILVLPLLLCCPVHAQGTAFTYQGQLTANGSAASGEFDFTFGLYTNIATGNLIGTLETNLAVGVTNGIFTTTLNFSNAFNGSNYWLGIGVRTNGAITAFTPLTPRQAITPTPYAITASNLTGTLTAAQLTGSIPASSISGTFSNSVSFTNLTNVFAGNGSGLTGVPGVTASNMLYAYDTTEQYVNTQNSWQIVTFTATTIDGWSVPASGEFVAGQAGTYLVQYQAHFYNGSTTTAFAGMIRAVSNVTSSDQEIMGSEGLVYVPAGGYLSQVSRSFIVPLAAGQMLSLEMTGNLQYGAANGYGYLATSSTVPFTQFYPSITITIVRVQ